MQKLHADVVEAKVRELHGNLAAVGRACGVTRTAVHRFIHKRPNLVKVLQEAREVMLDNGESVLYSKVLAGEGWAVRFYLRTQGKSRGYFEKKEINNKHQLCWDDFAAEIDDEPVSDAISERINAPLPGRNGHHEGNGDS